MKFVLSTPRTKRRMFDLASVEPGSRTVADTTGVRSRVAAPGFAGTTLDEPIDVFLPLKAAPRLGVGFPLDNRRSHWLYAFARLAPGATAERAAGEVLSLPIFPELTRAQLDEVVAGVRAFYGRAG